MNIRVASLLCSGRCNRISSLAGKTNSKTNIKVFRPCVAVNNRVSKFLFAVSLPPLLVVKAFSKKDKTTEAGPYRDVIEQADGLYEDTKFDDLYDLLAPHHESGDAEVLWRLARAIFEKAREVVGDMEKLQLYEEALGHVTKALDIDDTCFAAHKWTAILLDYVWRFKSTKERILRSFEIRKHMERAIELNPKDSTSYYLLGEWCFTFAELPWYKRKTAAVIFTSPPTSTYKEALDYFEAAEKNEPYFYSMNLLMIGKCLLQLGENDRAITVLKQARDYPVKTADDIKAHSEAEELLKKLIS